jgi:hypothetical protein
MGRIHLQVEGGCFYGFLFVACQASEAVCKSVGDSEFH